MILSDTQIREARQKGEIRIEPFEEKQVQPASYDLRVGEQGITTSAKRKVDIRGTGYLTVAPGDFAVIQVYEEIGLNPSHVGHFGLRSKYARRGLVATTGLQIDPGYQGRLMVGVTNLTPKPVVLAYKDDFLSVEFYRLESPVEHPYSGPYQGKRELGPEEIEFITESEGMALSEVLTTLRSLSANVGTLTADVAQLTTEMKHQKWVVPLLIGFGIAVMAAVVALK